MAKKPKNPSVRAGDADLGALDGLPDDGELGASVDWDVLMITPLRDIAPGLADALTAGTVADEERVRLAGP